MESSLNGRSRLVSVGLHGGGPRGGTGVSRQQVCSDATETPKSGEASVAVTTWISPVDGTPLYLAVGERAETKGQRPSDARARASVLTTGPRQRDSSFPVGPQRLSR